MTSRSRAKRYNYYRRRQRRALSPPIGFGLRWLTAGGWAWWRPGPGRSGCWDGWDRACGPGHQRGAGRAAALATQDATGEPRTSGCDHVERAQRQPDGAGGSPAPRARPDRYALPVDRACAGEPAERVRCGDAALRARGAGTGPGRGAARRTGGPGERVELILDQSRASERHQILMLALGWGERALPLAWRVEETPGPIGFAVQQQLLDTGGAWLPEAARVRLLGDRFYGTPALIAHCQALDWNDRLRLKGNLRAWVDGADAGSVEQLGPLHALPDGGGTDRPPGAHQCRLHPGPRPRGVLDHRHVRDPWLSHHARLRPALGHRADVL